MTACRAGDLCGVSALACYKPGRTGGFLPGPRPLREPRASAAMSEVGSVGLLTAMFGVMLGSFSIPAQRHTAAELTPLTKHDLSDAH